MFDRNRASEGPLSVEITLGDGREMKGKLVLPPGRTLTEVLNGGVSFLEFEPFGGERTYLAKSALEAIRPMELPTAPNLGGGRRSTDPVDPFAVLGVRSSATREEVRQAYMRLAKIYHPDRYAMTELPREVSDYLSGMAQRVNAAYEAIETARQRQGVRQEPVFTKGH